MSSAEKGLVEFLALTWTSGSTNLPLRAKRTTNTTTFQYQGVERLVELLGMGSIGIQATPPPAL
jgi:hypothetical protein